MVNIVGPTLLVLLAFSDAAINLAYQDFNELQYMNLSADPCENFYEYTCGNFENLNPLQSGEAIIDQFTLLENNLAEVVNEILKTEMRNSEPVALQKAKAAYQACVDHNFQDALGMVHPELEVVKRYGGFPVIGSTHENFVTRVDYESFGWNEIADLAAEFGINIFLTPSLWYDTQNSSRNVLRISSDAMDIPVQFRPSHSESYEDAIEEGFIDMVNHSTQGRKNKLRGTSTLPAMEILLRKLVIKMKRLLGSDRSNDYLYERVANISNFMKGIYFGYIPEGTEVGPITNEPNATVVTLKQLNAWTKKHFGDTIQLDWVEYVKRLLQYTHVEVDEDLLVMQPNGLNKTLYGVLNWYRMNDEEIIKSSALLRTFVYTASDSDSETRAYFEEYLKATGKTIYPRWKYCTRKVMDATGTLSLALGATYEYQLNYFDTSKLESAWSLITNLQSSFKEVIEEANWMDDDSKAAAQTKANNIITLLGYPGFVTEPPLLDYFYENLQITTWDHYANAKNIRAFQQAYTLNMINLRERKAWEKSPFDVNAYYNRQNNRIIFPVAMLNPIFFQGSASLLDYSRIGMVIAHEMTHGFDSQGFFYNPDGVIEPWWSNKTIQNFMVNTQCFIDQYSNYSIPEINSKMNGSGSLNENLADNGGLRTSLNALKKIFPNFSDKLENLSDGYEFTAKQMFFIGYGTMWCNTESTAYLQSLKKSCDTTTSCHARSEMRVNGVVSNMAEFSEAFSCPVGSPMNPENKCRLW